MTFDLEKVREANHDYLDLQYQLDSAEAEIERLRDENAFLEKVIHKKNIRLNELEDALRDAIQPGDADKIDTFLRDCMCPDSEGPTACCMCPEDTIEFCNLLKRVQVASQHLHAEGKIGPDAKPRSWQITEERKAALGVILARIEYDQSLPGRFNYTVSRAKDTLRAMLEEAQP